MVAAELTIPVGRMPVGALPPPSQIRKLDQVVRIRADWRSGGVLLHGTPDTQVRPDQFELLYSAVPAAVANAVWAHYRDHGLGTFVWTYPRTGAQLVVFHAAAPSIVWRNRVASADARAVLEIATARN